MCLQRSRMLDGRSEINYKYVFHLIFLKPVILQFSSFGHSWALLHLFLTHLLFQQPDESKIRYTLPWLYCFSLIFCPTVSLLAQELMKECPFFGPSISQFLRTLCMIPSSEGHGSSSPVLPLYCLTEEHTSY